VWQSKDFKGDYALDTDNDLTKQCAKVRAQAKKTEQAIAEQFETNRSMRVEAGDRDEITGGVS
jgi:hypothetical protein